MTPEVVDDKAEPPSIAVNFVWDQIFEHGTGWILGVGHPEGSKHRYMVTMRRMSDTRCEVLHVKEIE